MERMIHIEIEVTSSIAVENMYCEDRDVPGIYDYTFPESEAPEVSDEKLALGYTPEDRFTEHALDLFHGEVAIKRLDDFSIDTFVFDMAPDAAPAV